MKSESRKSQRGPAALDPATRRGHCVSVRLNAAELTALDGKRGPYQRGEWLRVAALDRLPPVIPQINREAWVQLARAAANLNQIAHQMNVGAVPELTDIRSELAEFRAALLGVALTGDDDAEEQP